MLQDVATQNPDSYYFLNLFNLPSKITEKMVYQFYADVPALTVIWARGKWSTADVKFAGHKNFEKAVRLGEPVFEGCQSRLRTSFLNLPKE